MKPQIEEWSVDDHGVENEQYWRGAGTACTRWTDCATGIGSSAREAGEDALESLAQNGWSIPDELEQEVKALSDQEDELGDECWHYVVVFVK